MTLRLSPDPTTSVSAINNSALNGVSASSGRDVWAVGTDLGPLMVHNDGRLWRVVPGAHLPAGNENAFLNDVVAITPRLTWAVGSTNSKATGRTLVEHWDGTHWQVSPSIDPPGAGAPTLTSVAETDPHDVWAVGTTDETNAGQVLIEHWDGNDWDTVTGVNPPDAPDPLLDSVSALSGPDVWAVGATSGSPPQQPLIEYWNGRRWRIVPGPSLPDDGRLYQVRAYSPRNVWAVGASGGPLVEHWDGTRWSLVPQPPQITSGSALEAVAALSAHEAWTVGYNGVASVIEHATAQGCPR